MNWENLETKLKAKNVNNDHIKILRKLYRKAPPENLKNLQPEELAAHMKRGWDFYYGYRGKGIEVNEDEAAEILGVVNDRDLYQPITPDSAKGNVYQEIGKVLNLDENEIKELKKHYPSRNQFLESSNVKIHQVIGINEYQIGTIRDFLCLVGVLDISVSVASALATASIHLQDIIKINPDELDDIIKKSKVNVPHKERANDRLRRVIESAKMIIPDKAYFYDSISSIKLNDTTKTLFERNNIHSFDDLRNSGTHLELMKDGKIDEQTVGRLKVLGRLDKVTHNFPLVNELIDDGIISANKLSRIPRNEFKKKYKNNASEEELDIIHKKAVETTSKNFGIASWAFLNSRNAKVNKIIPGSVETFEYSINILRGIYK